MFMPYDEIEKEKDKTIRFLMLSVSIIVAGVWAAMAVYSYKHPPRLLRITQTKCIDNYLYDVVQLPNNNSFYVIRTNDGQPISCKEVSK